MAVPSGGMAVGGGKHFEFRHCCLSTACKTALVEHLACLKIALREHLACLKIALREHLLCLYGGANARCSR